MRQSADTDRTSNTADDTPRSTHSQEAPSVLTALPNSCSKPSVTWQAVCTASKMAIEGFTASLALEAFNVRVKLVEPGYGPTTRFTSNTGSRMEGLIPEAYAPFAQRIFASLAQGPAAATTESDVAEVVLIEGAVDTRVTVSLSAQTVVRGARPSSPG
jgi:NAD(P)-dependent dehydrogenase (short-subunit alcohol dehydrogenase family)